MKLFRLFGLTAVAALATLALLATGSASATELCKAAEDPCEVENVYEAGTTIKASSEKALFETSLGTITCTSSTLEGESWTSAGSPMPALFSKLSFGSCKLEAASCTAEASELPYYALIEKTGTNVASLELRGETSTPLTVLLKCSGKKEISCTLKNEKLGLEFKGGKPAQIVASKESFEKASGTSCPEKTSLTATYSVSSPEQVQIAQRPVKLCRSAPTGTVCPIGKAFSGGVKGYVLAPEEVTIIGTGPEQTGTVSCGESGLVGSYGENGIGEFSTFKMESNGGNCPSTLKNNPTVAVAMVHPADKSSFAYLPSGSTSGVFTLAGERNLKISLTPSGAMTTCVYRLGPTVLRVTNPTGLPMAITASVTSITGTRTSGLTTVCPTGIRVEGNWYIETAGGENIWVSET